MQFLIKIIELFAAYYLLKSIFFHEKKIMNQNNTPIDFLFISHYVGEQNIFDNFHDSYFGNLINDVDAGTFSNLTLDISVNDAIDSTRRVMPLITNSKSIH